MKTAWVVLLLFGSIHLYAQDLNWNTSAVPDNSTSFNFGSIGSPASTVTYAVTGIGTITAGPARFTTVQADITWRTAITFATVSDLRVYTFTFSPGVCGLSFILYDIDGDNTSGDRCIVTANNFGTPQNITMTSLDPTPPTITGNGTATATGTGTQGNQTDDRVQVTIAGCVTTLIIQYGNNPAGAAGGRSFSIGNLNWLTSTLPVNFLHFSGEKIAPDIIQIKWSIENAINVDKYEIERSRDGQNFTSAGFITNLTQAGNYSFTDHTATQGTLFYHIKEIDIDGRYQYSTIIALKFDNGTKRGITIFPNPGYSSVFVTTNNIARIDKVQFFSLNGKLVFQKEGPENRIDISAMAKGLYLVKITDRNGEIFAGTFTKQ